MNNLVIIFSIIAIIASIGAIVCLIGGIISNRRLNKKMAESDDTSINFTKDQMRKIKNARITPEFLNSKAGRKALAEGANEGLKTSDPDYPNDDLLKSVDKHLKHIDLSLAAIAIAERDRHNDPLNSIKLGLLSSPHARYVAFIKTLEGKKH